MNIIEGLQIELARNRKLVEIYAACPTGMIARCMIQSDINYAESAMATGDTIAMIQCYETLKGNKA